MTKFLPIFFCLFFVACGSAHAEIKAEDRACMADSDCSVVTISCNSCCPSYAPDENAAVNSAKVKDYESLGVCTPEHIKNCGVPECGMMPTPYPVATCVKGTCTLMMHAPEQRPQQ